MKATQLELPNLDKLIAEANPEPTAVRRVANPGRPIKRATTFAANSPKYTQLELFATTVN